MEVASRTLSLPGTILEVEDISQFCHKKDSVSLSNFRTVLRALEKFFIFCRFYERLTLELLVINKWTSPKNSCIIGLL